MRRLFSLRSSGAALVLVATLAACSATPKDALETACPPTQIAVPSDRVGHSDETGRLRFVATIEQLTTSCRTDDEAFVEVDVAFDLKAERGPVFQDRPVELNYYIATVDPRREIVDKQILSVSLTLAPDETEHVIRESLTLRLPVSSDATGANYSLYIGFQPDQSPQASGS
ncbi:MAG: hypothetical protein ACR2Q4_05050 [Geminicoccaceae bacterium]